MEPVPHDMKLLSIPLLTCFARDLKRGRKVHTETWSSELKVWKLLYLPPFLDLFCWLLNPFFFFFFGVRLSLGCEVGFILNFNLVKNNVFQREWHQIKDNNISDPENARSRSWASQAVTSTCPKWESKGHVQCYQVAAVFSRYCVFIWIGSWWIHTSLNLSWRAKQCSKPSKHQPALPSVLQGSLPWLHSLSALELWLPFQDASLPVGRAGWQEATPCQADMNISTVAVQLPLQLMQRCQPMSLFHLYSE